MSGVKPFYAWFTKRDNTGKWTHHIHMIEMGTIADSVLEAGGKAAGVMPKFLSEVGILADAGRKQQERI